MEGGGPSLLLVVPIYNEERILNTKLDELYNYVCDNLPAFHLVLSVDDSGDKSVVIAENFAKTRDNVTVVSHTRKMGRGYAVREAWSLYDSDFYSFIDADLATGLDVIRQGYRIMNKKKAEVLTASRFTKGATVSRPLLRNAISRIYNFGLRTLFHEGIRDHQCGFKIINDSARNQILSRTTVNSWFWDAELLIVAKKMGLDVVELPVDWVEEKYIHTNLVRLLRDVVIHGIGILHLLMEVRSREFLLELRPVDFNAVTYEKFRSVTHQRTEDATMDDSKKKMRLSSAIEITESSTIPIEVDRDRGQ